jgi:hypothetical protein
VVKIASDRSNLFDYLYSLYNPKYSPPGDWARRVYIDSATFNKYAPLAKVYAPQNADEGVVARLVTEREPVNIGMDRLYNLEGLKSRFGYDISYYQRYYNQTGTLAPNIGVYLKAPVIILKDITMDVHFYNAIGYALDSKQQPDYKANVIPTLKSKYECLLARIFQCAKDIKATRVIMPIIGGGAFSDFYPGGGVKFRQDVFLPAFRTALNGHFKNIQVDFMGEPDDSAIKELAKTGHKYVGFFPACIYAADFKPETTLVGNAWDCHSILGNGNKGDSSIDGHIGRVSAIQFLGLGLTNPHLRKNIVRSTC